MPAVKKRILYFLAGQTPTLAEKTVLAQFRESDVYEMTALNVIDVGNYGGKLIPADFKYKEAGTTYPAAYANMPVYAGGIPAVTGYDPQIEPARSIIGVGETVQLRFTVFDLALQRRIEIPPSSVAWVSGTPATATVGASTGLMTGVAVGSTIITGTYSGAAGTATFIGA